MLKIKTPATTANLGPGFDCLGMAFDIYNEYLVEKSDHLVIEGCDKKYANSRNLFNIAFQKTMKKLNKTGSFHLILKTNIPIARGLGSSASMIVAGCLAANKLYGDAAPLTNKQIFQIATKIEGHPDNIAPALFKGLTASAKLNNNTYHYEKFYPSKKLNFYVLIPDFKTSTEQARKLLPATYDKKVVVNTISHSILLIPALQSGNMTLLQTVAIDYIHEPYRKQLIPDYNYIKKIVNSLDNSVLLISGSGPTLLIISTITNLENNIKLNNTKNIWQIKKVNVIS